MTTVASELAELVATAREATESLADSDLRRAAFERVLEHLLTNGGGDSKLDPAGTNEAQAQAQTAPIASGDAEVADRAFADEQQRQDALATYFKIKPEQVAHIFEVSNDEPDLVIHSNKLSDAKSRAVKEICLLLTGARTALGHETATAHIRSASDHYGRLDSSNFMTTLSQMSEISVLGRPGSKNRVIRMKALGAEASQTLAQRLIGE
ncbi:MAG: hypothetical protein OXE79_06555 [Acidimicrobiaceae bacterium]|nr:hypothetical protein [Acidimicrobiaceae bacterium]MCY4280185.1 hypothetical protein [Acidimicrobiaceae bacterium]MCY4293442.1 hypothetical protein [Acidimicrobiaceae bacterium]